MVTIKEIAEICGVSATTVSNVLNGKAKASEETRQKILNAVEEYGYTPNAIAQGLRNRRSKVIAVISEDIAQFTSPAIIESIVEICENCDYRVVVYNMRLYDRWQDTWYGDEEKYHSIVNPIIRDIRSSQIDGVIYVAGHARMIKIFNKDFELPTIMCYAFSDSKEIPSVVIDDKSSAYEVVSYLICKGHKRIGFVGGRADNIHTVKRLLGYQKALYDNKIFYDPELVYYGDWSRESGYKGAKELFDKHISAYFGISDRMTGGIYDFLYEKNVPIGKDISVAGFDNENISSFFRPALTTTELPLRAIGKKSAELILDRLENPDKHEIKEEPEIFEMPCKMIIRDSVKEYSAK